MNDSENTFNHLNDLIDSVSDIKSVDTAPFFKDKVLSELAKLEGLEESSLVLNWLTPRLQIAALLAFVFLNLGVLYYYNSANQDQELETFAQTYGLSSPQEESILN
ncbi:hypothetical protein [Flagellimonas sp.]|uniref:hypothetical protein n=1 Tax=Flagellimonas sp. TaxID=2058762 RepID=UPI003F4A0981